MIYRKPKVFSSTFSLFFVAIILIVFLAACGKATPQIEGKNLYTQKCAACHGLNGEGTSAGPAIAGHSMPATMTQMRNPMGMMPAFPPGQLSDSEADEIAEFVASLGEAKAPVKEWEKQTTETIHYLMALLAIKEGDAADARHHLQDVLLFIKEPMHKTEIENTLNLIAQGNIHDAEHEIEEMAEEESPSGITMKRFHLILAQRGVEAEDVTEVKHHLIGHFLTLATEAEKELAREAVELAEKGDFHEAEHEIEELLNM